MPTASHRASGIARNPPLHHPRADRLRVLLATSLVTALVVTGGAPAALHTIPDNPLPAPMTLTVESGFISLTSSSTPIGAERGSSPALTITKRTTVSLNPGENGHGLDAVINSESPTSPSEADKPTPGSIPVVLVHGTAENQKYWDAMKTSLHDAGMNAFTFEYGQTGFQGLVGSIGQKIGLRGFGDVEVSTQQLADEVATVLDRTGAKKVDLVGHSQGGLLIKNFLSQNTADNVANVVQLAPSSHGTTFSGLANFVGPVGNSVDINGWKPVKDVIYAAASTLAWPSLSQQTVGSQFLDNLNRLPDTKPGVDYLVVSTKDDVVATPYRSQFITAAPGSTAVNIEVHSLPGVARDEVVDHGLNTGDVISAVTNYLKSSQTVQHSADQIKANPGTTLTREGATTTVSEGGHVTTIVDGHGSTATTPYGARLEIAGKNVTLNRNGQAVSISDTDGVTVASSPTPDATKKFASDPPQQSQKPKAAGSSTPGAEKDETPKATVDTTAKSPTSEPRTSVNGTQHSPETATSPQTDTKLKESPSKSEAGKAHTTPRASGLKPKYSSGSQETPDRTNSNDSVLGNKSAPSAPSGPTSNPGSGTTSTGPGPGAHAPNGSPGRTGSSSSLGGQQSSAPNRNTDTSGSTGSRSAAGAGDSKPGHPEAGSSSGSGDHKKSADGPSHEHTAGDS
ncbi:alpha/beta fold hydrolase [Mycobacterium sp. NPDC050853]|uniref:esterase/lipase family protein n=1 Tax=Mycobacterium sp. NPDC050853 TaxID=3155160 RepID=UPI0033E1939E